MYVLSASSESKRQRVPEVAQAMRQVYARSPNPGRGSSVTVMTSAWFRGDAAVCSHPAAGALRFVLAAVALLVLGSHFARAEDAAPAGGTAAATAAAAEPLPGLLALTDAQIAAMDPDTLRASLASTMESLRALEARLEGIRTETWQLKDEAYKTNDQVKEIHAQIDALKAKIDTLVNALPEIQAKVAEHAQAQHDVKALGQLRIRLLKQMNVHGIDDEAEATGSAGVQ